MPNQKTNYLYLHNSVQKSPNFENEKINCFD